MAEPIKKRYVWNRDALSQWDRRKTMHEIAADLPALNFGCPACRPSFGGEPLPPPDVYFQRTSPKSATMECTACGLRWTVTWKQLERRLAKLWERGNEPELSPVWALAKMAHLGLADPAWIERLEKNQWAREVGLVK